MIGLHKSWPDFLDISVTENYSYIQLKQDLIAISNAPLLGGQQNIKGILNYKVAKEPSDSETLLPPDITLQQKIAELGLVTPCLGLMTAASMKSFRFRYELIAGYQLFFAVTVGLANSRRIGDFADYQEIAPSALPSGTINSMLITNIPLSPAARLEGFALLAEAKTAACYDLQITSEKSGKPATGTGTDVTVLASGQDSEMIPFCGKHTLLGQWLGHAAYDAITASILAY